MRVRRFGPKIRVRVDLHGVSVYWSRGRHTLIRWEWIKEISAGDGVVVRSDRDQVELPPGAFGLDAQELAERLSEARCVEKRPDVIGDLAHR